jgi:hypothetical protein
MRLIATPEDVARLNAGGEFTIEEAADPLSAALGQPSAVVIVRSSGGDALIATVRNQRGRQAEELAQGRKVVSYAATGLLGLDDEVTYSDEPEQPKKHWWQRRKQE